MRESFFLCLAGKKADRECGVKRHDEREIVISETAIVLVSFRISRLDVIVKTNKGSRIARSLVSNLAFQELGDKKIAKSASKAGRV